MPAVIFRISPSKKENWEQAIKAQLWDTKSNVQKVDIQPGTHIFFWMNGSPNVDGEQQFVGRTIAQTSLFEITEEERIVGPWVESDEEKLRYLYRVYLENFDPVIRVPEPTDATTRSGQLGFELGTTIAQQDYIPVVDDADIQLIHDKYFSGLPWGTSNEIEQLLNLPDLEPGVELEVRRGALKVRKQQRQFKTAVQRNYHAACALTGENVGALLEAAHIIPIGTQEHTDRIANGILLRVDIHRLFDAHLLTFVIEDQQIVCRLSPILHGSSYGQFEGKSLAQAYTAPDPAALANHNIDCAWLTPDAAIDLSTR